MRIISSFFEASSPEPDRRSPGRVALIRQELLGLGGGRLGEDEPKGDSDEGTVRYFHDFKRSKAQRLGRRHRDSDDNAAAANLSECDSDSPGRFGLGRRTGISEWTREQMSPAACQ